MTLTDTDTTRLWDLGPNQHCEVVGFDEALSDAYRIRLMELGFHPGEHVTCLMQPGMGAPRVYQVSNTVYSLDGDIAACVQVRITPQAAAVS